MVLLSAPLFAALLCVFLWLKRDGILAGTLPSLAGLGALGALAAGSAWLLLRLRTRLPSNSLLLIGLMTCITLGATQIIPDVDAPESSGATGAVRDPKHVILIVVDTLRADHLSCYSEDAPPTPILDALARESLQFTETRSSAPFTFPSMCSILTGLAPTVHLGLHPTKALPAAVPTLAERMRDSGFLTGAIVRNPSLSPACRIDRGFEEYHFQREPCPPTAVGEVLLRQFLPEIYLPQVGAEVQTRRASEWIERYKDRNFLPLAAVLRPAHGLRAAGGLPAGGLPAPAGRYRVRRGRARAGWVLRPRSGRAGVHPPAVRGARCATSTPTSRT